MYKVITLIYGTFGREIRSCRLLVGVVILLLYIL